MSLSVVLNEESLSKKSPYLNTMPIGVFILSSIIIATASSGIPMYFGIFTCLVNSWFLTSFYRVSIVCHEEKVESKAQPGSRHLREIDINETIALINEVKDIHNGSIEKELTSVRDILNEDDRSLSSFPNTVNIVIVESQFLIQSGLTQGIDDIISDFKTMITNELNHFSRDDHKKLEDIRRMNKFVLTGKMSETNEGK